MAATAPQGLSLSFMSVNVNGLGQPRKVRDLLMWLRCSGGRAPDVVLLQEVQLASKEELLAALRGGSGPGLPWRGEAFFAPGSSASRGVAVLVAAGGPLSNCTLVPIASAEGRVVRVDCDLLHHALTVLCVYAPATVEGRAAFFDSLGPLVPADRHVVMGGDFNCVLDPLDESTRSQHRAGGAPALRRLMQSAVLVDVWRGRNHGRREYTHVGSAAPASAARLDRFLVSTEAAGWVGRVEHQRGGPGGVDHDGVRLTLQPPGLPVLGPGGRGFPVHLLYHPGFKPRLVQFVEHAWPEVRAGTDPITAWEALKGRICEFGQHLHAGHVRSQQELLRNRQRAAAAAEAAYAAAPEELPRQVAARAAREAAAEALAAAAARQEQAAMALDHRYADRNTEWFHRLPQAQPQSGRPALITALQVPGVQEPVPLVEGTAAATITAAATAAYSSDAPTGLFRPGPTDAAGQATLLQAVPRTLDASRRAEAEGPEGNGTITLQCLTAALSRTHNGKQPGSDGLPYEVYKVLWEQLGPILAAVVDDVLTAFDVSDGDPAALPASWLRGIITLIFKGTADKPLPRHLLLSYRPITLLNSDFKLVSLVIASRLQPALAYLVSLLQSAFVHGRDIADNALHHVSVMQHLAAEGTPGALFILDLEKAYDRVDRGWVHAVAAAMGFGPGMRRWLHLLLAPSLGAATVNGLRSAWFPVRNGLAQGSPLSPLLWAMQLEPLTAYLQQLRAGGQLRTPLLAGGRAAPPVAHHADDTKLLVRDATVDGPVAMRAVSLFCSSTNAKVNVGKCKGLVLGSHPPVWGVHAPTGVDFGPQPVDGQPAPAPPRLLGLPLSLDQELAAAITYATRMRALHSIKARWQQQQLSLVGRAHVAKQVMASSVTYHASLLDPGEDRVAGMVHVIESFVAASPLPEDAGGAGGPVSVLRPEPEVARLPRHQGGIALVDLHAHVTALQAKAAVRALGPGTRPWQLLARHCFAAAAPYGRPGLWWVLSAAPLSLCGPGLLPLHLPQLRALRASQPSRLPIPEWVDLRSLLCEPLYHNQLVVGAAGQTLVPPLPLPAADWPMTVGELRAAPQAVRAGADMAPVLAALPPPMRAVVDGAPLPSGGWVVSACGLWARSPAPAFAVHAVDMAGVLEPVRGPAAPGPVVWVEACVLDMPQPKPMWTYAERVAYGEAPPAERAALIPTRPVMLGPWASLACYPPAHAHGRHPLQLFTVRECRTHIQQLKAAARFGGVPLRPAAWPRPEGGSLLAALAQHWDDRRPRVLAERWQDYAGPALMPCMRLGAPPRERPPPRDRGGPPSVAGAAALAAAPAAAPAAAVAAAAAVPAAAPPAGAAQAPPAAGGPSPAPAVGDEERRAVRAAWRRLWDAPVGNRAKTLAWRLMHGRLPCGLYRAAHGAADLSVARCGAGGCREAGRRQPLASLVHLFVHCSRFAAAREWLAATWEAVAGHRPPMTQEVLLGDREAAWPRYPSSADTGLWTALRLTWLLAVWEVHTTVPTAKQHSRAVVVAAVHALRSLIMAHWAYCCPGRSVFDQLPARVLTRPVEEDDTAKFLARWSGRGRFCVVSPPGAANGGVPTMELLLSLASPVPAPAAPEEGA